MIHWLKDNVPEATLEEVRSFLHEICPDEPGVSDVQLHTISR